MKKSEAGLSSTFDQPSIIQKDDGWYWCDEVYAEYGPCSSEESALARQLLYARVELSGEPVDGKIHVLAANWRAKKDAEPETAAHPCDEPAAYLCVCDGACSCHWTEARRA